MFSWASTVWSHPLVTLDVATATVCGSGGATDAAQLVVQWVGVLGVLGDIIHCKLRHCFLLVNAPLISMPDLISQLLCGCAEAWLWGWSPWQQHWH